MPLMSPGVEINEIEVSITIPAIGNSTAAFAGVFTKGPSDKYLLIQSGEDLINYYGKPTNDNYNDWFQCYNFLQYSNKLLISRAVDEDGSYSETTAIITGAATGSVDVGSLDNLQAGDTIKFHSTDEEEYQIETIIPDAASAVAQVDTITISGVDGVAKDADYTLRVTLPDGSYEDVTFISNNKTTDEVASGLAEDINVLSNISITATNSADGTGVLTLTSSIAGQEFTVIPLTNSIMTHVVVTPNTPADEYQLNLNSTTDFSILGLTDLNLWKKTAAFNAIACAPAEGQNAKTAAELKSERIFIANEESYEVKEMSLNMTSDTKLKFIAKSSGAMMNKIEIAIARQADFESGVQTAFEGINLNGLLEFVPDESKREIAVIVKVGDEIEGSYVVSLNPNSKDYRNKSNYIEDVFKKFDSYLWVKDNDSVTDMPASRLYTGPKEIAGVMMPEKNEILITSNGSDGNVGPADIAKAYGDVQDNTIFGNKEELDVDIIIANEQARVASGKLAYDRGDCIAFIGAKFEDIVNLKANKIVENLISDVNDGELSTLSNSFCATFGNYKYQYDKFNDKYRWISLAGDVAGLRADTNTNLQAWWASAGLDRGQVKNAEKLAFNPNTGQRDLLYKNRINPVVTFPGQGNAIVWGQKTLVSKSSAFDRINVRGLFNILERSISRMAKNYLFEFNDVFTRNRFTAAINPFLESVKAGRGIYEFYVRCDESNNPPEMVDANRFIADIAIKPTRVAEYITLNFAAVGTGVSFSEVFV